MSFSSERNSGKQKIKLNPPYSNLFPRKYKSCFVKDIDIILKHARKLVSRNVPTRHSPSNTKRLRDKTKTPPDTSTRKKESGQPTVEEYLASQGRSSLLASDVAQYGRYNGQHVRGEQGKKPKGSLPEYLQGLLAFMGNREAYTKKMTRTPTEGISVNSDWSTAFNGNHRILGLRLLGPKRVKASGMDRWIKIDKV